MIAVLVIALLAAAPAAGTIDRRPPIDQCADDADFAAFRARLQEAVARRDRAFILSIIPDDVLVNFGGDRGRADFARIWRLDQPDSPFWAELRAALALGCAREEGEYVAPSFGPQLAPDYDPFEAVVAVRRGAVMRSRPDAAAEPVASLDWDVLLMQPQDTSDEWLEVRRGDGRQGFVRRADVRSPLDYRAHFARSGGRWQMVVFIAGD